MTFAKLDSGIIDSSLWDQPDYVVRVWIAFLAKKDDSGYVQGTMRSMRGICNISNDPDGELFNKAIWILEAPDPNSKTPDYEGRRIKKVDGGWLVLNSDKYRLCENKQREQTRERVKRYREKIKNDENNKKNDNVTHCNVTETLPCVTSVSVSVSKSVSEENEFDNFRQIYPGTKRGNKTEFENFKKRHRDYKSVLPLLGKAVVNQSSWRVKQKQLGMFVPEWKNLQTWINQRCWEEENPEIPQQQNAFKQQKIISALDMYNG